MKFSKHGQVILNEDDVFEGMYSGKITDLGTIFLDNDEECKKFNENVRKNHDSLGVCKVFIEDDLTQEEFDKANQEQWFMPEEYKEFDVAKWCLSRCTTSEQEKRVIAELQAYEERGMIPLLQWTKHFVDTCHENGIVWGVGRGSSVASFVLYLLGVHQIDSVKYNLDWQEFLR